MGGGMKMAAWFHLLFEEGKYFLQAQNFSLGGRKSERRNQDDLG